MNLFGVLLRLAVVIGWSHAEPIGPFKNPIFDNNHTNVFELYINPHIIGGKPAALGQLPWQVVTQLRKPNGYFICGAVIIHSHWVLTAAHCTLNAFEIDMRLGTINLGIKVIKILLNETDIKQHPGFKLPSFSNDISLLKTPKIEFTKNIRPIRVLPTFRKSLNTNLVVSGWGRTCDDPSCRVVQNLNFAVVTPITNRKCMIDWDITYSMVCTVGVNGGNQTACRGDSGGPLVQLVNKHKYLVGLSSFGAEYCADGWPSVFTRVNKFCKWMRNVTSIRFC